MYKLIYSHNGTQKVHYLQPTKDTSLTKLCLDFLIFKTNSLDVTFVLLHKNITLLTDEDIEFITE